MIAVAGYINYTGNLSDIISVKDTKDASSDGVVIDENTGEIVNNDAEPDDNSLMEPGSVMLTSGSSVSDSIISEAKLNREQVRASSIENLKSIADDAGIAEDAKKAAVEQLAKLEDVRCVKELKSGHSVCRELVLITVGVEASNRPEIIAIADTFRGKIVDVGVDTMMIELTGNQTKLNAFIKLLDGYEIKELVRTGIAGLSRGAEVMLDDFD